MDASMLSPTGSRSFLPSRRNYPAELTVQCPELDIDAAELFIVIDIDDIDSAELFVVIDYIDYIELLQ